MGTINLSPVAEVQTPLISIQLTQNVYVDSMEMNRKCRQIICVLDTYREDLLPAVELCLLTVHANTSFLQTHKLLH